MKEILNTLFSNRDEEYAKFQLKITPTVTAESCIGVRVPKLREIAKSFAKTPESRDFMRELPHKYYDENMLHSLLINEIRDYDECVKAVDEFLQYVDNWAVCDIISPKCFKKKTDVLIGEIRRWASSDKVYTSRFGLETLMNFYLDKNFVPAYLEIAASVVSDEYYLRMMVAWFFATALAKQWDATVPYIEQHRLDDWCHKKTIQKACESFRITSEQKNYLRSLK